VGRAMGILHGVLDPHFADWPHLAFNLAALWLAPLRLVGVVSDQASGYLWVRILSALLGSLTVLLVFAFGRQAYGSLAGLFAAAALAVAFLAVRDSHFATPDIPLSLACLGALYVAYRTVADRGWRPLIINGIALGIAAGVKYNGALVLAGMTAAQVLRARAHETRVINLLGRLAVVSVIGLGALAITSPFLVLDPSMTAHGIGYIFLHLGTATAPSIGWVELSRALWFGLGPVLVLVGLTGVAYAAWRRQPADWILLAFVLVYFIVIGTGRSVFFRYADPLIPPLLLLGGRVVADLVRLASTNRVRRLAVSAVLIVLVLPPLPVSYTHLTLPTICSV